ncbi:MAG TPA: hypothetical protein VGF67_27130, partial [Ktedonobacteraceae bacterium]
DVAQSRVHQRQGLPGLQTHTLQASRRLQQAPPRRAVCALRSTAIRKRGLLRQESEERRRERERKPERCARLK